MLRHTSSVEDRTSRHFIRRGFTQCKAHVSGCLASIEILSVLQSAGRLGLSPSVHHRIKILEFGCWANPCNIAQFVFSPLRHPPRFSKHVALLSCPTFACSPAYLLQCYDPDRMFSDVMGLLATFEKTTFTVWSIFAMPDGHGPKTCACLIVRIMPEGNIRGDASAVRRGP